VRKPVRHSLPDRSSRRTIAAHNAAINRFLVTRYCVLACVIPTEDIELKIPGDSLNAASAFPATDDQENK
jgi:hypothetical protein